MSNTLALCVLVGQVYSDAVSWVYHKKSWENPPSLVRGDSRPLCQASKWEYNWDSEAGKRSPWQPSEEGQHVRLCTGSASRLPLGPADQQQPGNWGHTGFHWVSSREGRLEHWQIWQMILFSCKGNSWRWFEFEQVHSQGNEPKWSW